MGGTLVLPETDDNMQKVIGNFNFTQKEVAKFYRIFQKLDKKRTGLVKIETIFKKIEWQRNLMTDCLLDLLDIEHEGELNFSDFLFMVASYIHFETPEILRYMFYCFDADKTGFFEIEDLNQLLNAVNYVKDSEYVKGNVKKSWGLLNFETGPDPVDYKELKRFHNEFPQMFAPAFRLQQQMMFGFGGEIWWTFKKRKNQNLLLDVQAAAKKELDRKEEKKNAKLRKKIMRNMGLVR
jgi:Ca2+-binding EF-hand superfamily protein